MSLLASLLGLGGGPLTRADRKRWAQARTLDDLGELTALWLEGRIDSQPGYYGRVDVDEDDAPGLTAALIACNRAGYLTNDSQAGYDGEGYDGARWRQLATVDGYATEATVQRMRAHLGQRFTVLAQPLGRRRGRKVVVTWREGVPFTAFGGSSRSLAETDYDGCSAEALRAVRSAWTLTVYDPRPGHNQLWAALEQAARS